MVVLDPSALLYWTLSTDRLFEPARLTMEATASLRGCSLVTSDRAIADFYSKTVW
ncbi:MAG: hypothetical protein AB7S38_00485 [Vulcanimicrobiota bacterium]